MDFKSQIATTRDQSEILLSLGLKPETADMVYHHKTSNIEREVLDTGKNRKTGKPFP